ncbi:hypothetical protein [Candidatus Odyssella acanthamoebae]|uniref:Uncharacterized protein n=1 Tax=Candidatus Odyssella acanthamoebae TaxID=91604 RepID=A0A077AZP0_9PROT|nr:hypothetical protein [Candidatus Paracaedibacter acanthamoebae]AIK97193.1 hypothetical protein ID47_11325 [Candidatus Paracaedibacter acanthamoebae]
MIKVICKYARLSDVPNSSALDNYRQDVNPLDYDFYLTGGIFYQVLGVTCRSSIPWLYIVRHDEGNNIDILPAVLFDFDWQKVPKDWYIRINGSTGENMELLPEKLVHIDHWYERYIDEDPAILEIISLTIHNNSQQEG